MNDQTTNNALKSHIAHEKHITSLMNEKDNRFFTLRNKDCIAYLLNARTLEPLDPILQKRNTWLTIGDYNGFEAKYFKEHNQSVMASDLSDSFLKEAKSEGLIDDYIKVNVEHIALNDNSYDYVS